MLSSSNVESEALSAILLDNAVALFSLRLRVNSVGS